MNSMSQFKLQKKQERKREKIAQKKEKLRKKKWKRINARIERGIVFLAVVVFGVSVLIEIDEVRSEKGNK